MKWAALVLIKQRVADVAIRTYCEPQLIIEWMGPTIPIPRPTPLLIGLPELLIRQLLGRVWAEAQQLIEAELSIIAGRLGQLSQPLGTAVTLTPLDEGEGERLSREGLIQRKVFTN